MQNPGGTAAVSVEASFVDESQSLGIREDRVKAAGEGLQKRKPEDLLGKELGVCRLQPSLYDILQKTAVTIKMIATAVLIIGGK